MNEIDGNEHCKEVYAHSGLALFWAQCFEHTLQNILLIHSRISGRCVTLTDLDGYEETIARQTLGRLLRDVRQHVSFSDDAEQLISTAHQNRNFLAHRFFKDRATEWYSFDGRKRLLDELDQMQKSFRIADTVASAICRAMGRVIGITDEVIDAEVERLETQHRTV